MKSICVVQINVVDMDEALDFYCGTLGLEAGSREFYPQIVEIRHEGVQLILNKVEERAQIDYPRVAQTLLNFQVDDLEKELAKLKSKGVELIHDTPQECPVGVFAALRDPSGNVHELLELQVEE
jgi:predicted enzyme related to lactoylglutathione lyase